MSEISAPERIAHFLNGYLGNDLLDAIVIPINLAKNYKEMTTEEQDELFEFVFHDIFKESAMYIADEMKRELRVVELNLIKRRVMDFLKQSGMKYKK